MKYYSIKKISTLCFFIVTGVTCLAQLQNEEQQYIDNAPFKNTSIHEPVFPDKEFSIKNFGAVADGITLNTEAINKAIDACSNAGGGHVIIPSGLWLTGPIQLKSN